LNCTVEQGTVAGIICWSVEEEEEEQQQDDDAANEARRRRATARHRAITVTPSNSGQGRATPPHSSTPGTSASVDDVEMRTSQPSDHGTPAVGMPHRPPILKHICQGLTAACCFAANRTVTAEKSE